MSKTTALHVHHPFWYISFIVHLTTPDVKLSNLLLRRS